MDDRCKNDIIRIIDEINLIQNDLKDKDIRNYDSNNLLVRSVLFSIIQIGERLSRLEKKIKDEYPNLPWRSAKSMRNIIVHEYDHVDLEIIHKTISHDLPKLKDQLEEIINYSEQMN